MITNTSEIQKLLNEYNAPFKVNLKAATLCLDIMLGRYPCIWCTWDARSKLEQVVFKSKSSAHSSEMYHKLCEKYDRDGKNHAIDCEGVEDTKALGVWMSDYMQCSTFLGCVLY